MSAPASTTVEAHPLYPFAFIGLVFDFQPWLQELARTDPDACPFLADDWCVKFADNTNPAGMEGSALYGGCRQGALCAVEPLLFGSCGQPPLDAVRFEGFVADAFERGDLELARRLIHGRAYAEGRRAAEDEFGQALESVDKYLQCYRKRHAHAKRDG